MSQHCMRPHRGRRRKEIPEEKNNNEDRKRDHVSSIFQQLPYFSKFCLKNSNKYYSFAHVIFSIFILVLNFSLCSGRATTTTTGSDSDHQIIDRADFVCNNNGKHECVCNRFNGNLDNKILECTQFIKVDNVSAIKITLHKVNLEARLHTIETYQQYFRRRIANIISQYCEHQANECPGTPLRIPKVDNSETTTQLFLDDDYEPPITQDNVIILRVNFLTRDRTELYFVVTKDSHVHDLSQSVLMDPQKIKLILSAQLGPLSRVLGGVYIDELAITEIHKEVEEGNRRLIILIVIIGTFMGIVYTIAIIRCSKETIRRNRLRRKREKEQKYGPSYGTCTDKLLADCDRRNGKPKSTSIVSRESVSFEKRVKKTSEIRTPTLRTPTYEDDRPSLDARSFNRMFACDPSQLPAEYHRSSADHDDDSINILMPSPPLSARSMGQSKDDPSVPSVIFISSSTPESSRPQVPKIEMLVDSPEPTKPNIKANETIPAASLLETAAGYNIHERPLSRRGSRNSTPEEGEEFAEYREDTPEPLGDEAAIMEKLESLPKPEPSSTVEKSHPAPKFGHWSSDSESENEVYQRLSEVSEGEEVEDNNKRKKRQKVQKNASSDLESATSDEDEDKGLDEEEMLDRHQYERLHESPTHHAKTTLPDMSMELDAALQQYDQ